MYIRNIRVCELPSKKVKVKEFKEL